MNRYSLKWRILLLFTLLMLSTQGSTFFLIRNMTQLRYSRFMERADRGQAEILAEVLSRNWEKDGDPMEIPRFPDLHRMRPMMEGMNRHGMGHPMTPMRRDWLLLAPDGRVLHNSMGDLPLPPDLDFSRAVPVLIDNKTVAYVMVGAMLGNPMASADRLFLRGINRIYFFSFIAFTSLGLILALLLLNRLFTPLKQIHEATGALAAGDYSIRTGIGGKDEVGQLAMSFDQMAEAMENARKWKEQLIADTAHELRTPVALIRGNLEMISEGIYSPSPERLEKLNREVQSLSRLIGDMQTLSSMEGGNLVLDFTDQNPLWVIRDLVESVEPLLKEKSLSLESSLPESCPDIPMDLPRFQQVIMNLLTNAIRYSPVNGTIRISLLPEDTHLLFRVDDQGPGIPPEDRERIFERFTRLESSRNRQEGGRGLGLAIARAIVLAMKGKMGADDSPLGGVGLWFQLPLLC